jgi:hypothetical protein
MSHLIVRAGAVRQLVFIDCRVPDLATLVGVLGTNPGPAWNMIQPHDLVA